MKKLVFVVLLFFVFVSAVSAMGRAPEKVEKSGAGGGVFLIDDFESGSLRTPREWWTFDIKQAEIASNSDYKGGDAAIAKQVGDYSLLFKGQATNWYAGGAGAYMAKERQNLSTYSYFQIDIYGNGPGSGTLKIELYDDDNNNWQVEQNPTMNYAPIYDDKYVSDIRVDWSGWKRVSIPLDDFVDDNDGVGDDIWNPKQGGGSGGLLQVQIICLGASDKGDINCNLDNISLAENEE